MTPQEKLKVDGFVHVQGLLDEDEIGEILRFAGEIGHGKGEGYLGKRLATSIEDPSRISAPVRDKLNILQRKLFGHEMLWTQSVFFSVDPDDPEHSVNFPFHQEHGSYFDFYEHLRYVNLYIVLEKEDIKHSNVTVIPFSELERVDPELHRRALGSGAARYAGGLRFDDITGGHDTYQADLEKLARTPLLRPGDLLVLRGDVIHRTQNQKCRRTAISIRAVAPDVVCGRESFEDVSGTKLAFLLGDSPYYGTRDYIFEELGIEETTARELQSARERIRRNGPTAALDDHITAFTTRLRDLQQSLRANAVGTRDK